MTFNTVDKDEGAPFWKISEPTINGYPLWSGIPDKCEGNMEPQNYETKDSGTKETFSTGYQRDSRSGKGRYDLLPLFALERLAKLYERGSVKYGDRNFAKGAPFSRVYDSAMRHLFRWGQGDRSEDHLSACLWNVSQIMEYEAAIGRGELDASLNDMPTYKPSC